MHKVGIVGDGQLGRMMIQAAVNSHLPYEFGILGEDPNSSAYRLARRYGMTFHVAKNIKDFDGTLELAEWADVVTYEIESVNVDALESAQRMGKPVYPSPASLRIIKDKFDQKTFLRGRGLPVPDFLPVESDDSLYRAGNEFGYPVVFKRRAGGYDGRGNYVAHSRDDLDRVFAELKDRRLMAEPYVNFDREVSVIVARDVLGNIATYRVGENIHDGGILRTTIVPARVNERLHSEARDIGIETMKAFDGVGVFGIEMFVTPAGVMINEVAPRVHNSGHYTIEAYEESQFLRHLKAISGTRLCNSQMLYSAAVMRNILSPSVYDGPCTLEIPDSAPPVYFHDYKKDHRKPRQKMGHLTAVGEDVEHLQSLTHRALGSIRFKKSVTE